jgi:hypothetical protein
VATDDVRAVLEAVAFGDDPRVTPGERLRAAEQLTAMSPPQVETFGELLQAMPAQAVVREADAFLGEDEAQRLLAGDPDRPVLSAALQRAVEERAQALLVERVGDVEAEIERRANERATQLYEARAFRLAQAHDSAQAATGDAYSAATPEAQPAAPAQPLQPPPGLSRDDPSLRHYFRPRRRPSEQRREDTRRCRVCKPR